MECANVEQTRRDNDTLRYVVQAVMTVCEGSLLIRLARQRGWGNTGVTWSSSTGICAKETNESHTNPSEVNFEGGKHECERHANVRRSKVGVMGNCFSMKCSSLQQFRCHTHAVRNSLMMGGRCCGW